MWCYLNVLGGEGGIIYIHDVEEYFWTVPPMNTLGSLYAVLLVFLFNGAITYYIWCDVILVSVYINLSTSNNLVMIIIYHKYLYYK